MSKHTPGPWLVNPYRAMVLEVATGEPICALLWPTKVRSEYETRDNAELIAAAPDLLAACKAVLAGSERSSYSRRDDPGGSLSLDVLDAVEAAIRKAEGTNNE